MQDGINVGDFYQLKEAVRGLENRVGQTEERIERRLDRFEEKMDDFISAGPTGRRNEWGLAVQILSFGVMALISVGSLLVSVLRSVEARP